EHDALVAAPESSLPLARRLDPWSRFWETEKGSNGWIRTDRGEAYEQSQRIKTELRQFRETCLTIDDFNRNLMVPEVQSDIRRRLEDETHLTAADFDDVHNRWLLRLSRIREAAAAVTTSVQPDLDMALFGVFTLLGLSAIAFELYAHPFDDAAK